MLFFCFYDCTFCRFCDCSPLPDGPYRERAPSAVFCCACLSFSRETLSSIPVSGLLLRRSVPEPRPRFSSRFDRVVASPRCNSWWLHRCETTWPVVLLFFESVALAETRSTRAPRRRAIVPCSSASSASRRELSRWCCRLCDRKTSQWSRSSWISCSKNPPGANGCWSARCRSCTLVSLGDFFASSTFCRVCDICDSRRRSFGCTCHLSDVQIS